MVISQKKYINIALVLIGMSFICSCSDSIQTIPAIKQVAVPDETIGRCTDPRPEVCTQDYRPVCATRDNGIRCITTPCDSDEKASYSNACSACADPKVFYYQPDACP